MSLWVMTRLRKDTHRRLRGLADRLLARSIDGDNRLPPDVTPDGVSLDAAIRWLLLFEAKDAARKRSYRQTRRAKRQG